MSICDQIQDSGSVPNNENVGNRVSTGKSLYVISRIRCFYNGQDSKIQL